MRLLKNLSTDCFPNVVKSVVMEVHSACIWLSLFAQVASRLFHSGTGLVVEKMNYAVTAG